MASVDQQVTMAMSRIQAGQLAEAEVMAKAAIEEEPLSAAAQHVLGLTLYLQRKYDEALVHFQRAVKVEAKNPLYVSNLGEALRRLGQFEEALKQFERATVLMPEFLKAHLGLGNTYRDLKRTEEAVARFRLILAINPRFAEAYFFLAATLVEMARDKDAIPLLRKAIALRPNYVEAMMLLANLLEGEEDNEDALEVYRTIMEKAPKNTAALNNMGNLLKNMGKMTEAVDCYTKAIELDPNHTAAFYNLSRSKKGPDKSEIKTMEKMLKRDGVTPEERVNLHFALGKLYDDSAEFDKAFRHFDTGNQLDARGEGFNPDLHTAAVDRIMAVFNDVYFQQQRGGGCESELPVFVLGMPRSGTTLVEQVIASHPKVFGAGELRFIGDIVNDLARAVGGAYPDNAMNLDAITTLTMAEEYLGRIKRLAAGQKGITRITDKMPGNFLHLGMISTLFPKARIIHCRREPLDVCLSCYSQNFTAVMPFSRSLTNLGHYWRDYARLMDHWHAVLPGRILDMDYATMVGDQEAGSRRLIEWCGLDWDDACLNFHKTERSVKTASTWQVRQPIYTSSLERWRNYESYLGPVRDSMGDAYDRYIAVKAAP